MGRVPWNWELGGVSVPRKVLIPQMGWDWQYLRAGAPGSWGAPGLRSHSMFISRLEIVPGIGAANVDLEDLRWQLGEKSAARIALEVISLFLPPLSLNYEPSLLLGWNWIICFRLQSAWGGVSSPGAANTTRSHHRGVKGWNCASLNLFWWEMWDFPLCLIPLAPFLNLELFWGAGGSGLCPQSSSGCVMTATFWELNPLLFLGLKRSWNASGDVMFIYI